MKKIKQRQLTTGHWPLATSHYPLLLLLPLVLTSCFGVKSQITLHKDLSGTIALEYRINKDFLALGTLDGNASSPIVPVGERDFRRTVQRIDGLSLKSFRTRHEGSDDVYRATLDFANVSALVSFLGGSNGIKAEFHAEDGVNRLSLQLPPPDISPELAKTVEDAFAGYTFELDIKAPSGKSTTYHHAMAEALGLSKQAAPRTIEVTW